MPAAGRLTIGQLARAARVPSSTVRYYERIGLLEPDDRSAGNYRLYGQDSLRRLTFIRSAQSIGFTLKDIESLVGSRRDGSLSCKQVQALIEERLADVQERLENLQHIRKVLESSLRKCRTTERRGSCRVIEALQAVGE